jgi:hypothetical protein
MCPVTIIVISELLVSIISGVISASKNPSCNSLSVEGL